MTFFGRLRERSDARIRDYLTRQILGLPCPLCAALPGTYCDPWSTAASLARPPCGLCGHPPQCPELCDAAAGVTYLEDSDPLLALHTARWLAAASTGTARKEAVLAQFRNGREPHSLRKADQEART